MASQSREFLLHEDTKRKERTIHRVGEASISELNLTLLPSPNRRDSFMLQILPREREALLVRPDSCQIRYFVNLERVIGSKPIHDLIAVDRLQVTAVSLVRTGNNGLHMAPSLTCSTRNICMRIYARPIVARVSLRIFMPPSFWKFEMALT